MKIRILLALALCAAAVPLHAQAWRFEDIGSFRYRPRFDPITDRDESEAVARTAERLGGVSAYITWACHESGLMIYVTASDAGHSEPVRMIYRFDRDRPDTVAAITWPVGGAVSVPPELHDPFTARARSASLLVVRVIHGGGASDRYFDLTGSNRALGMLGCVRDLRPGAAPWRRERGAPNAGKRPPLDLTDREFEAGAVEAAPRLTSRDKVVRAMARGYPREMRRSGTGGEVTLRLRVLEEGVVDPGSITVVASSSAVFREPARTLARMMRAPDGRPMKVWITPPVAFVPKRD